MKKIVAGILAFSLIIGGIYFVAPEASEAKAETTEETTEQIAYVTEAYTGDEDVQKVQTYLENKDVVEARETTHDGWLFAGWFTDEYCTTPVTAVSEDITTYHAKFVEPDVLSVKLQITKGTEASSPTTNMRLVSSVDSLDYAQAGFEVYYDNTVGTEEPTKNVPIQTVYERIVASSESGVEYNYSPKVVDTDSEYFVTATLIDIAQGNFGKPFHIKPYWVTLSGAKVYGTSRYVTIAEDALSTTKVNVPVKIAEGDAYTVTEDADASVAYHDGTYAHFRMSATAASKSLTKFNVSNGTETAVAYHRNLETLYNGTNGSYVCGDKTWYTAYADSEGAVAQTEFVIATAADLYALPTIVNTDGETFSGKTIYVVADITANNGTASTNGWTPATTDGTSYYWQPIGDSTNKFQGVFDGGNHSIEGICANGEWEYCALFGYTKDADIQNLYLKNSLLKTTKRDNIGASIAASIVATGDADLTNVRSSAKVSNNWLQSGGLIGNLNDGKASTTSSVITNCVFDGSIYCRYTGGSATSMNVRIGGFIGYATFGKPIDISHSLFSGTISFSSDFTAGLQEYIGGFLGDSNNTTHVLVTISDSLSAGTLTRVDALSGAQIGSVAGRSNAGAVTLDKVSTTTEFNESANTGTLAEGSTFTQVSQNNLLGLSAYIATDLDFADSWSILIGQKPMPRVFADNEYEVAEGATKADTSWYTGDDTEYKIETAAHLYGLAMLVNGGNTFEGITIKLDSDIDLNEGWDGELKIVNGGPVAPEKPVNEWIPIGTSTNMFKGTFEGNGKTIKGLYIDKRTADGNGAGLFGNVYNVDDSTQMCTIQNFGIDNSYIYVNAITSNYTGGIVGQGEASINNVYCDVDIYGVNSSGIGGFIGSISGGSKAGTLCQISNCWYDGIIALRTSSAMQVNTGGYVGYILWGVNNTLEHCLFTGEINYKTASTTTGTIQPRLGGFIGRNNNTNGYISISDSLSAGTITLASGIENPTFAQAGSIIGSDRSIASGTSSCLPISNVYVSADYTVPAVYGSGTGVLTSFKDSTGAATTIDAVADWETSIGNLDAEYWAATTTIPVLSSLADYAGRELP